MSNFQSLLSSFQDATATNSSSKSIDKGVSNGSSSKSSIKDDISQLYRTSQIQSSFKASSNSRNATTEQSTKPPIHIAICATIVNKLHHEEIWKMWLSHHPRNPSASASIHVHAKIPRDVPNRTWLRSKLIPVSHNPNWNDYKIIQAMLSLSEFSIKDEPGTTHCMMVTESCIPISSLDDLIDTIYSKGVCCSFLDFYGRNDPGCTRFDEHACFSIDNIPKDAIHKSLPGWALFSKDHLQSIIDIKDRLGGRELFPLFKGVWAPEEVYFPTALALLGKLHNPKEVVRRSLMWSKWDHSLKGEEKAHPIEYYDVGEIANIQREGFIFMRKWKKRIDSNLWRNLVLKRNDTDETSNSKRSRNYEVTADEWSRKKIKLKEHDPIK
mmetsp:Transcript_11333/g.13143  ORF Transcript_11333/g.13143 Transcript_11333/m.13143 type:complete len:382 (+) Transcript_11333:73-1218(+)